MALQDITRSAVLAAMEEHDALGRETFLERYGFGSARSYFLRHDGRLYDSKAVVGAAHGVARPDLGPLSAEDFSGGAATVGALLGRLGFEMASDEEQRTARNPAWTRDELILALDYYLSHPGEARERNRALVKRKKASFVKKHGHVFCEACGFDFAAAYGSRGADFIECHHTRPVAFLTPGEPTKLADLSLLCANCHRMVHVRSPWLSMPALKAIVGRVNDAVVAGDQT